jgi:hypothetical protein
MKEKDRMKAAEGGLVIVVDTGNYKASYSEEVPFTANLYKTTDYPTCWVRSVVTGKEYELYSNQILELMEEKNIKKLINLKEYGES